MPPSQKAKIEIISTTQETDNLGQTSDYDIDDDDDDAHDDGEDAAVGAETNQPSTSQKKKKKKKKSKAMKALNALRGHTDVPQGLVDGVLDEVKATHSEDAGVNEEAVRTTLEHMKILDAIIKGKAGIGGKNKKDMGEHKFWATQPVPQPGEGPPEDDGHIEPSKPAAEVRQEAYPLPKDFEWTTLDLDDPKQNKEVYDLLSLNYVEDDDASFRFQYSAEFLRWALRPPGYHKEWHVGVRVSSNKKLVAFISGVPITLRVRRNTFCASEINYLCVHKKLRSKRLAPVMIKEVTRQCHLKGIFQAIYTAGVILPTPVSTCRYYHRSLNIPKLVDIKFTFVPQHMTVARMMRVNKLPSSPQLADPTLGLREMEDRDIPAVSELFARYMLGFDMAPIMTMEEARHQFLSGQGEGHKEKESWGTRREGQVTWSYVVENPETHKITDFFSFYSLPSTVIKQTKHKLLEAAYLFYYATDVAFQPGAQDDGRVKKRLEVLVKDALIIASQAQFDVFNALTLMDNAQFLKDLKFGPGDGFLNFYLYNWRTAPLAGVEPRGSMPAGKGVGVVML